MAEINFGLIDTQAPARIANALMPSPEQQGAQALQVMQLQQAAGQNALAKYQLSTAKRADTEAEQLRALYAGATDMADPALIRRVYAINPDKGLALEKAIADRAKTALEQRNITSQISERDQKGARDRITHAYESFSRLSAMPGGATDAAIDSVITDAVRSQGLGMQDAMRLSQELKQVPLDQRSTVLGSLALNAKDRLATFAPKPTAVTTPTGGVNFVDLGAYSPTAGKTPAGFSNFAAGMTPYQTGTLGISQGNLNLNRARATDEGIAIPGVGAPVNAMPGAQPAGAPVNAMIPRPATPAAAPAATMGGYSPKTLREMAAKGVQPDGKGGQTFIPGGDKDPAVITNLAAATAAGTAAGKDAVAAVRTLPNAIASSEKALANIDAMLGDARIENGKIKFSQGKGPHPGFEDAVGFGVGLRFLPGTAASDFQERFREITGGAFLEAFETLRGGGAITEKEGEKATAAKTRMSLAQGENEFVTAAREYQDIIRVGVKRAQDRLKAAQGAGAASKTPAAPTRGVDTSNPLLR